MAEYFKFANNPLLFQMPVFQAYWLLLTGMRLIQSGQYENAVIAGADVISKFILSGFQSFQAISDAALQTI